jgi:hypothetical protein
MSLPHRSHIAASIWLLLAFTACRDPIEPEPQPGFNFIGGGESDTIEAFIDGR